MSHRYGLLVLLLSLPLLVVGCKGGKTRAVATTPTAPAGERATAAPDRPSEQVEDRWNEPRAGDSIKEPMPTERDDDSSGLRTVYFGYDSHDLNSTMMTTLRDNADWLKSHPNVEIVVEGHCDERGTIEYNLSLGEKRAAAVRDYLVSLGLARTRLHIKTFGEERPAQGGHDESAWSRNRRAEFATER